MPDLTNKVLREISDLTKNMDVLVRELKSARESSVKSSDPIDTLNKNLTNFEEKRSKREEESLANQGILFKNLTDSITKSIGDREDKLLSDLTKTLSSDIGKAINNLPDNVAQVKADNSLSDLFNQIAKKTSEKTPGLEKGGEVTKKGIAVVGERGPELVELSKGDKVRSKEEQLLQMELEDIREKEKAKQIINTDTEKLIVTEKQKLEEKDVVNEYGVTVPKKEIQAEKVSLEGSGFDKDFIEDEIKNFITSYREDMSLEDIQKSQLAISEQKQKEKIQNSDVKKIEGRKENLEKIKSEKSLQETNELTKPKKEGFFSKIKDGTKNLVSDVKKSIENEKERLSSLYTQENSPAIKKEESRREPKIEKIKGDVGKLADTNTKPQESPKDIKETKSQIPVTSEKMSPTKSTPVESSGEKPKFTPTSNKTLTENKGSEITANDISELKGLLAAIYKTLSGPLTISSDIPFRPNSNHL
jgi:hypothetical protein